MAEFASFARDSVEWLWNPISQRYRHFKNYHKHVKALADKARTVEARRNDVGKSVDAAKSQDQEIRTEVQRWQERVDNLLKDEADFENRIQENKSCIGGCLPDCRWRCRLSKQAEAMAANVDTLLAEQRFDSVSLPRAQRAPEFKRTESMRKFQLFSSTEVAMNKVMEALRSDSIRVIGVHGMGGVGKTTMVKQVAEKAVSEGLFDVVVMATVSQAVNLRRIQGQIADGFGLRYLRAPSVEGRATEIRDRIVREKRVLIILDDVWKKLDLNRVGIPYGSELENCESKILLTTRLQQVCTHMDCHTRIKLQHLSEPDSWEFFKKTAGTNFDSEEFEAIGKLVAKECGGLPIALVAVAKALGDKDMEEWDKAARRLQRSMTSNHDEDETVFECIKLSYDFLNKQEKACFLLCCLFPEDHNVEKEELARYGLGLALFQEVNTMEEAREDADSIAKKLIASGLLLDGDKSEQVKMHDVIRDVAIRITRADRESGDDPIFMVQTGWMLKEWPRRPTYESYTAISLMRNEMNRLPDGLDCPKLQTLMLQDNSSLKEIPSAFFEMMNALKILDLNGTQASSLPPSIESLKNLQILHLDRCKFKEIAILGLLEQLEILSLRESLIEALPEDMAKLSNLRMLDLTLSTNVKKIPSTLISSLSHLEELYLKGSFAQWEDAMEPGTSTSTHQGRNAFFDELVNLPCLTILKVDTEDMKCFPRNIENVPSWVKFDICICRRSFTRMMNVHLSKNMTVYSRSLLLDIEMKDLPDWFIEAAAKRAEKLIYSDCHHLNLLEEYKQGQLASLKSLDVEQCGEEVCLMYVPNNSSPGSAPVFESLQELRIFHMNFLEQICVGELPTGSLGRLKALEVQQCNSLVDSLLPPNLIKRLGNLEKLLVNGNSVEEVFGFEGLEQGQVYLGRLQEIRLDNMFELAHLCRGPARFADFRNLKFVTVIRCMKLRNLFSVSISDSLMQLEDLWIEECVLMEEVIRNEHEITREKVILPRLKTLALKNQPMLSNFYVGNASLECPSLEYLHVQECQSFRTQTSDFHSSKQVHENDEQHMKLLKKRPESKLVDKIVEDILKKLSSTMPLNSNRFEGLIGMKERFRQVNSLLSTESPDVCIIGLWGMGGIGKTTLANAVYSQIWNHSQSCCFLTDVRGKSKKRGGLEKLREKLFSKLLDEENVDLKTPYLLDNVKKRLKHTRVFIVLDDVSESEQLEHLVGDGKLFGPGSRILVTTREHDVIRNANGIEHEVEQLNFNEALELFNLSAFNKGMPPTSDYTELTEKMVDYAGGNPLAIKVLGTHLRSLRSPSKKIWERTLKNFKDSFPNDIQKVLRISYEGLDKNEKNVFLDIACFFKWMSRDFVEKILNGCNFDASGGIDILIDRSLITVDRFGSKLQMHDLVQEMGREIVRQESTNEGERSRLWKASDIVDVLENNQGTNKIEGIFLNLSEIDEEIYLESNIFRSMRKLRLLKIYDSSYVKKSKVHLQDGLEYLPPLLGYLEWHDYPLKSLPQNFKPKNLIELNMPNSQLEQLGVQDFTKLRDIDLSHSSHLTQILDLSAAPNLERINLQSCTSLLQFPSQILENLNNLIDVNLSYCNKLQSVPDGIFKVASLRSLSLKGLSILKSLPMTMTCSLVSLNLDSTGIISLPSSIRSLKNLRRLCLFNCETLAYLPSSLNELHSLKRLHIGGCSRLTEFPDLPTNIETLYIHRTAIKEVPSSSIEGRSHLLYFKMSGCESLEQLPTSIFELRSLYHLEINECSNLKSLPEIPESTESSTEVILSGLGIRELPSSIRHLINVRNLRVGECKNLESIPSTIYNMAGLHGLCLDNCPKLEYFPSSAGFLRWDLSRLNLSRSNIIEILADIKELSMLRSLILRGCKKLRSLPELPLSLEELDAGGCASLEVVLNSKRALTVTAPTLAAGCQRYLLLLTYHN